MSVSAVSRSSARKDVDQVGDGAGYVEAERWTISGPPTVLTVSEEKTQKSKRGTTNNRIT